MKKHTKSAGGGQAQGLSPWNITSNECSYGLTSCQLYGGGRTQSICSAHFCWLGQHTIFGRGPFSSFTQGCPQLFIFQNRFINNQASIVFRTFGKEQRLLSWLPYKADGRQTNQQQAENHIPPEICENSRAQYDLKEAQKRIPTFQKTFVHLFNSMAVTQLKFQVISGHRDFLSRFASAPVEEEGEPANVALGPSWPLPPSISGLWVGMVRSYSLLLRGDCLSAVTVAWGENLPQTGRGPALRAPYFEADNLTIFWVAVGAAVFWELCLYQLGLAKAEVLAEPVLVVVCSSVLNPFVNSHFVIFWLAAVAADLSKLALFYFPRRAVFDSLQDCPCPVDAVTALGFCQSLSSTIPFGVSRANNLTRPNGAHQFLLRATASRLMELTDIYFGKRHDDVIRKIRSLDCSLKFTARNFTASASTQPPAFPRTRQPGLLRQGGKS